MKLTGESQELVMDKRGKKPYNPNTACDVFKRFKKIDFIHFAAKGFEECQYSTSKGRMNKVWAKDGKAYIGSYHYYRGGNFDEREPKDGDCYQYMVNVNLYKNNYMDTNIISDIMKKFQDEYC